MFPTVPSHRAAANTPGASNFPSGLGKLSVAFAVI